MRQALFAVIFAAASWPASAGDTNFDVLSYEVQLAPDFAAQTISGVEVVRFKSLAAGLDRISFTANTLAVTASIDGSDMVASEVVGGRLVFHLSKVMRKGQEARLLISFSGRAPKGLEFRGNTVRSTYAVCDYMICDYDRPGDKASLAFELLLPRGSDAVASGQRVSVAERSDLDAWRWRSSVDRSAYLFGFAAGGFRRVAIDAGRPELDVLTAAAPDERVRAMFGDTRRMLSFFGAKAGVVFPGARYTQVLVEGSEAQEAASHSTIGMDEISPILTDPHEDWVIAHELAHQWWGNAVTCADWRELWLNEGLTVFMVAAYKEQRWGRADYERELELANKRWAAAKEQGFDVPLSWTGTYPSLRLKRAMAYAKAMVFLDALRRELGEDAFWRGVKRYTRANWNRTVTARDLQRAMERASGRDLSKMFSTWVYGTP